MKYKFEARYNKIYRDVEEYIELNYGGLPNEAMLIEQYNALPDIEVPYDSSTDTLLHIKRVSQLLIEAAKKLLNRAMVHDDSKLDDPEKNLFDKYTPLLKNVTYGSDEYKRYLEALKPSLDHHYAENTHHPECYLEGINGMDLFDILEMFFDWKAAGERHADGDIFRSIEINKDRFNISPQLVAVFTNTAHRLWGMKPKREVTRAQAKALGYSMVSAQSDDEYETVDMDELDDEEVLNRRPVIYEKEPYRIDEVNERVYHHKTDMILIP